MLQYEEIKEMTKSYPMGAISIGIGTAIYPTSFCIYYVYVHSNTKDYRKLVQDFESVLNVKVSFLGKVIIVEE